ncbi:MAG: Crp/Fnr family transcriptional regulator, partial [Gemmobacter sp.]
MASATPHPRAERFLPAGQALLRSLGESGCRSGSTRPPAEVHRVALEANSVVVPADRPRTHVWVVESGILRMQYFTQCGRRRILGFILAGELVGVGRYDPNRCSVETVTDSVLCRIDRRTFAGAIEGCAELRHAVFHQQDQRLERLRALTWSLCALNPEQRICRFLVQLVRSVPVQKGADGSLCVVNPLPRRDVADHLGTSVETISRITHRLDAKGIIEILDPVSFRIRNLGALIDAGCMAGDLKDPAGSRMHRTA